MVERIPQSVARRVTLKAYLSTDHVSVATGKTIAVVISKNGGAFGNPSAGATNATEIANGWYYVDLSTTDTGTQGPLIVRGTASGVDDVEPRFHVVDAHNAGFDGIPAAAAEASGGLPTLSAAQASNGTIPANLKSILGTLLTETSGLIAAGFKKFFNVATPTGTVNSLPDAIAGASGGLALVGSNVGVATSVSGAVGSVTAPVTVGTNNDKNGYALTSAYDPAKTAAQAGDAMTLTAAYDAAKTAATQTSVDDVPTKEQNADALLGRNIAGGSDGGRDVTSALRATRNRVVIDGSTITVYAEDDTTPAWTGTVTRVELDALQEINPS